MGGGTDRQTDTQTDRQRKYQDGKDRTKFLILEEVRESGS